MEAVLNIFWLLMALGAFACWKPWCKRATRPACRRRQVASPLLALSCALAVFFPAVSVTDDLHPALYIADDSSALRRSVASLSGGHGALTHGNYAAPPAALPQLGFRLGLTRIVAKISLFEPLASSLAPVSNPSNRAPPKF